MSYLALDLSKSSTGWALWRPGMSKPIFGVWHLGGPKTTRGAAALKLNRNLTDLRKVEKFDFMFVEAPVAHVKRKGTSERNVRLALSLHAHTESFASSKGMDNRFFEYTPDSWRPEFIGRDENAMIKRAARLAEKSASDPLNAACKERCRQLGIQIRKDDEADAVGVLTYGILKRGITPPWLADETLRTPLEITK